jgi:DNA (cytosine-5)-methyltransferase 1
MKFGSLFTGVGGFDLGFERAGMECLWQVEFDKACQSILKKHWGETELFDDVRTVGRHNLKPVDVICGGFPCQDVSIAGKRAGLAGERSGLWSEFARIIDELEPKWVVIENVPGLLSSNRGRDFATVIRWLAERGYGVAWRILDSQYFGVAQRRRRVFVVGSFGNGGAAEILFECEGVRWDIEKSGKAGKRVAATIAGGSSKCHSDITSGQQDANVVLGFDLAQITSKANYSNPKKGDPQPPLNTLGQGFIAYENHPVDSRITETGNISQQLTSRMGTGGNNVPLVQKLSTQPSVRRLTPTECERLQGFPDGWTDGQADSHRYKQMGNAVTVNVAEWIGKRIAVTK